MRADGPVLSEPAEARFRLAADALSVRDGLRQAFSAEPLLSLSAEDRGTAEIVLAEVLNNVVEHACATGNGPILLALSLGEGLLQCRVEDEGTPMPGGALPAGRPGDPAALPEGGFGWHLIRLLCQSLRYERAGGRNLLSFSLPAERSRGRAGDCPRL